MKPKFLIAFTGLLVTLSTTVKGQYAFVEPSKNNAAAYMRTIKENATELIYYNNISTRAIRDFLMNFPEVSNENWFSTPELFISMFTLNDVNYRVDYDKRGSWIETFKTYDESNLPEDVRQSVKASYYDYNIYLVQEIQQPFHPTIYIVHLDGKKRLINIQICNGVIFEWQKFKKSNN